MFQSFFWIAWGLEFDCFQIMAGRTAASLRNGVLVTKKFARTHSAQNLRFACKWNVPYENKPMMVFFDLIQQAYMCLFGLPPLSIILINAVSKSACILSSASEDPKKYCTEKAMCVQNKQSSSDKECSFQQTIFVATRHVRCMRAYVIFEQQQQQRNHGSTQPGGPSALAFLYRWVPVNPNMDNLNSWKIRSHIEIAQLICSLDSKFSERKSLIISIGNWPGPTCIIVFGEHFSWHSSCIVARSAHYRRRFAGISFFFMRLLWLGFFQIV